MTFERWQQVRKVLYPALKLQPEERVSFVAEACADDTFLQSQVASLIGYYETGAIVHLRTPESLRMRRKALPPAAPHAAIDPVIPRLKWFDGYDETTSFHGRLSSNIPLVIGGVIATALIAALFILRR